MDDCDLVPEVPVTMATTGHDVINVFYHAILENDMAVVKDVVRNQKVDVNMIFGDESYVQPWHKGFAAIHIITKRAIVDSLKFLVALGGRVDLENKHGDIPLHIASKYGLAVCVEYLIQCDKTLINKPNKQGLTPLIKAVFKSENHSFRGQFRNTIKLLLDGGADPNICPVSKITPLHLAAGHADASLIELLLLFGANVNAICSQGTSPLLKALLLRQQNSNCVKILLDAGADVNISTVSGRTALHLAVAKCENECVRNILKVGGDPNCQDKYGKTPLWIAVHDNNIEIVSLLIEYGGNVNYHLPVGNLSLLSVAITENLFEMTQLLFDLGASVYTESSMGGTPLFYAVETQNIELVKLLLKENCELDVVSNARHTLNPQTAIQVAIELANLPLIKLLLEAGCKMKRIWIKSMIPALQTLNPTLGREILAFLQEYLGQMIKKLYQDAANVVWNGNLVKGSTDIVHFFEGLPSSQHTITSLDAVPLLESLTPGHRTIIVTVFGTVKYNDDKNLKSFYQNFMLASDDKVWKIISDTFRFLS